MSVRALAAFAAALALAGFSAIARAGVDSLLPPSLGGQEELTARRLTELAAQMKIASEMLATQEAGPPTQERLELILAALDELLGRPPGGQGAQQDQQSQTQGSPQQQDQSQGQQDQPQPSSSEEQAKQPEQQQSEAQEQQNERSRGQPGRGSSAAGLGAGSPDAQPGRWGELPARAAEELNTSLKEEFLERYRHLLRMYFKRLAEDSE